LVQRRVGAQHAVEDGLAVLGLADLHVRDVRAGLDEVAGRIDLEQAAALGADLAAEDQADVEIDAVLAERLGVALVHAAHGLAHAAGGFVHVGRRPEGIGAVAVELGQQVHHSLADRQVAGGQQHHDAVAGLLEDVQLAGNADLVHARVGARVGQENQARVQAGGYTVGHWSYGGKRLAYCRGEPGWRAGRGCEPTPIYCWPAACTWTETVIDSSPPPWRTPRTGEAES